MGVKDVHEGRADIEEILESRNALLKPNDNSNNLIDESELGGRESGQSEGRGTPSVYPAAVKYIVGNEFCERFCYYGMRAVLILYITCSMGQSESTAIMINHGFIATAYLTPLMGGALSDGFLGKYSTILYLSMVYAAGSLVLAYTSSTMVPDVLQMPGLYIGLLLIAMGTGGIKPCVSSFGGDQFVGKDKNAKLQTFFTVFYFAINAGSVLSMLITPLLREYGCPNCTSGDCSFALAFGLPAALMLISIGILVLGRARVGYREVPPSQESPIMNLLRVRFCSSATRVAAIPDRDIGEEEKYSGENILVPDTPSDPRDGRRLADGARQDSNLAVNPDEPMWFKNASRVYGRQKALEARQVLSVIWVMAPFPLFWCLFDQQSSTWTLQAESMNGKLGRTQILPDQMQMFNALLILILLPVFDRCIYPSLRRCGLPLKPNTRMILGMGFASLAFIVAGILQLQIDSCEKGEKCVHMLAQVPQYVLLTSGEVLFSVTGLEFAYSQAPKSMKALMQSIWLLTVSLGNILVVVLEALTSAAKMNAAGVFFLNSSLMAVSMGWFFVLSWSYRMVPEVSEEERND
eukprot:CAMPEP_0184484758 /NCGR_PEP_ID=MMETSP0113_2-20130426/6436_1 /TAXON_ID=91329 /ORGANISM="Norrisiella sphaerica, Strain BC52" /LENGTH=577 /DNA_ID=CAMNT_0026865883 /DNA_START=236 /DNA_END=1969 /DNA_ORIENTATION=+